MASDMVKNIRVATKISLNDANEGRAVVQRFKDDIWKICFFDKTIEEVDLNFFPFMVLFANVNTKLSTFRLSVVNFANQEV